MKVSLSPYSYQYKNSFSAINKTPKAKEDLWLGDAEKKQYEIQSQKLKTAIGITMSILLGVNIIYFAVKSRCNANKNDILTKNIKTDLSNLARLEKPPVKVREF